MGAAAGGEGEEAAVVDGRARVHDGEGAAPPDGGGKRLRALWELRREEREMKLRLDADELEYMMEWEQLGAVEGGKRLQVL